MNYTISLKENRQFKRVYYKGKSFVNNLLVLYLLENNEKYNRLGIVVNKKVGKAVVRNRVRRLIKENYRLKEQLIKNGFDIVFVARVRTNLSTHNDISKAMDNLLKRSNLLKG